MSAHHLRSLRVMISRPRRTDMLVAGRLFLVSALVPLWSLFDHDRTNVRPTSAPKSRMCPSVFGGDAVDFSMRHATPFIHRIGASASRFSAGQSCPRCRVVGTTRPVLGVWISGSRGEVPGTNVSASKAREASFCTRGYSGSANPFFCAICA